MSNEASEIVFCKTGLSLSVNVGIFNTSTPRFPYTFCQVWVGGTISNAHMSTLSLTQVWDSSFRYVAVPTASDARIIAGRGVFRMDELPRRERKPVWSMGCKRFQWALGGMWYRDPTVEISHIWPMHAYAILLF